MSTFTEHDILRDRVLAPIGAKHAELPEAPLTAFVAARGVDYDGELMIVGRAVNGWDPEFSPSAIATEPGLNDFMLQLFKRYATGECIVRQIATNWGDSSAFWRVTRRVVHELRIADIEHPNWASHLVWSNLFKVAPSAGGNPSQKLGDIQRQGCCELFKQELETYKPRRLLMLTGLDWANEFLEFVGAKIKVDSSADQAQAYGTIRLTDGRDVRYVTATHPSRKPESPWVEQVVEAFRQTAAVE